MQALFCDTFVTEINYSVYFLYIISTAASIKFNKLRDFGVLEKRFRLFRNQ